jgi:hypothetical protein
VRHAAGVAAGEDGDEGDQAIGVRLLQAAQVVFKSDRAAVPVSSGELIGAVRGVNPGLNPGLNLGLNPGLNPGLIRGAHPSPWPGGAVPASARH